MLYTGPIVLYGNIELEIYEHFLLFHSAILILDSKYHINNLGTSLAREFLNIFVKHSIHIYGIEFLVYNVHLLLHLADDVDIFGPLDNISAFPFENYLDYLKYLVHSLNKPLQQIHRRLKEIEMVQDANIDPLKTDVECSLPHIMFGRDIQFNCKQLKKLVFKNFQFMIKSYSSADCYCLLDDGFVVEIHNIEQSDKQIFILGKCFLSYKSFYKYPIDSKKLFIYILSNLSKDLELWIVHILKKNIRTFRGQHAYMKIKIVQ